MNVVQVISTLEEFLEVVFITHKDVCNRNKNEMPDFLKYRLMFRGQENKNYDLIPSIGRKRKSSVDITIMDNERSLIEMAKYKLPHIFDRNLAPINLLALLQHYGIPTRLLDVTSNPLVALYFASLNDAEDGEIFAFEFIESNYRTNYAIINAISDSYRFLYNPTKSLSDFYKDIACQSYFTEVKNEHANYTDEKKAEWIKESCKHLLFVNANEQLERQKLQHGSYILFPNNIEEYSDINQLYFDKIISPINKDDYQIVKRIILKRSGKSFIREKLEILGISEATLFSDNIDIVCKNIVKQYNIFS